ncbi:MAG: PorV/PorQ family protein [Ignavibacteriaceae bacterium]|nr:PorV/PorQ family protein [Ignavibacteriaceae bacterium]
MKKYLVHVTVLLALISFSAEAQLLRSTAKVGTTAANFLKIGAGARALSMGGAYAGVSDDIYSAYWNPAGIVNLPGGGGVTFNHADWLADISYDYAAAALHLGDMGTMFFTLTSLGIPEDKVRTVAYPEGDGRYWDASMMSLGVGFARKLTDKFSIGFHFKYIHEAIWNTKSSGVAIDIGTYYVTPFNDMVIGASIANFGTKMQLDGRDILFNYDPDGDPSNGPGNILSQTDMGTFDLPLTFRLGLAMVVYRDRYFKVTAALDATHPNDNTEYVNTGLEVGYDNMFFVRGGYKSIFLRDSEQELTFGGGFRYPVADQLSIELNYGFADYGRLKNVQYIDLSLQF